MDTDGNSSKPSPTIAVSVLGTKQVEMRKLELMSLDAQDAELFDELQETVRTLRRAFDLLAKRQTLLFQSVQELREAFEKYVESQSKES